MKLRRPPASPAAARPAAIEDVAGAAGVSIATVSRLLNKPNLVAPETAAKVYRAIERLGYRPNPFAQGLMTRRSQLVGILLPDIHGEFYSELLRGADAEANKRGYHLLVASEANLQAGDAAGGALAPVFRLIDGLALMITEPNPALWSRVQRSGLPVVVLDTDPHEPGVHSIVVDNAAGAVEATRHLLESVPATRCYFVGGPRGNFDTVQRGDAFSRTLRESGHKARKDQLVFGEYSFEWGQTWARGVVPQLGREPIGVLAGNDEIAYGVLRTFADAGCPAPERLRIVGFDDTRLASLLRPTLSTVRVPMAEIGAAAIAALVDRIEDRDGHAACARIPTRLIVRESSRG